MNENNKKIISSILETFYLTTKLPITCISNTGTVVGQFGYTNDMLIKLQNLNLNKEQIFAFDKELMQNGAIQYLNIDASCEVAIKHLSLNNLSMNYFFCLGPYRSTIKFIDNESNLLDYQYRPKTCINYLFEILISIIKDTFKSVNDKNNNNYISLNVRKAIKYVHDKYNDELTIDIVSKELNINKCYFCNIFKKETGITFSNFINKFRVEKSKQLLANSSFSILDVAISVGFNNQNYFAMAFKKELGMTPLQYRKEFAKS